MLDTIAVLLTIIASIATIGKVVYEIFSNQRGRSIAAFVLFTTLFAVFIDYSATAFFCLVGTSNISGQHDKRNPICFNPSFSYSYLGSTKDIIIIVIDLFS